MDGSCARSAARPRAPATPIAGAPRTARVEIASQISSSVDRSRSTNSPGNRRWSMIRTPAKSGVHRTAARGSTVSNLAKMRVEEFRERLLFTRALGEPDALTREIRGDRRAVVQVLGDDDGMHVRLPGDCRSVAQVFGDTTD